MRFNKKINKLAAFNIRTITCRLFIVILSTPAIINLLVKLQKKNHKKTEENMKEIKIVF